ncbi:MAG TPA: ergothioneine biosynthesis protein EgtB [Acidimicrobiales bacterium]|nr:ergothioneine biosynthesis protein EgtB [Acidimicrobiales bacterium]
MDLKEVAVHELEAVRDHSLGLLAPLSDDELMRQHSPLMSPLVWDLAHVGNYEDLWLVRAAGGRPAVDPTLDELYDAFRHPRADRPSLPLLGPDAARRYIGEVRSRALDVVDKLLFDPDVPLLAGAFVAGLCVQHEHQHAETMLATLQLMDGDGYRPVLPPPRSGPRPSRPAAPAEVLVAGGPFVQGTDSEGWAYDNERPAHEVDLPAFWVDTFPVTNGQYIEFIEAGGYASPSLWSEPGWRWRQEARLEHPGFWRREGPRSWSRVRFGWVEEVPADEPVQHVCWYEADAYARWAGKRLPTEAEWERAARGGRYPWGDSPPAATLANLGGRQFGPASVGSYPEGAASSGAQQMIGDVWEWTSSDFQGYPGFTAFPYREYSEVFFGPEYKVLRGGSWATHGSAVRVTFRNWDYPIRRQIFAGFRCARDA